MDRVRIQGDTLTERILGSLPVPLEQLLDDVGGIGGNVGQYGGVVSQFFQVDGFIPR